MKFDKLEKWYAGQCSPSCIVYGANEVDAAIAELKGDIADLRDDKKSTDAILDERNAEIAELKEQYFELQDTAIKIDKELTETRKGLHNQKYKRCLAMARWCERKRIDAADYRIPREKWELYDKWHNRWLELAEKFKEVK